MTDQTITDKKFCITVDVERDYGRLDQYKCLNHLDHLLKLFKDLKVKPTLFISTEILEKFPKITSTITQLDIQPHSHSHKIEKIGSLKFKIEEIRKSKKIYKDFFGVNPIGYRAPFGAISIPEINVLKKENFKYDSSVFPSFRPSVYNNLRVSSNPFYYDNGFLEIPLSTILFVPLSLSYMQLFGKNFFKIFQNKMPDNIIFDMHLHNIYHNKGFNKLNYKLKFMYLRNRENGISILKNFIELLKKKKYKSISMKEYYETITGKG
ncbi:hypothetical protein LCGC14_0945240 [marine sediment metagenome]|uniref:NodB homology domain-containing protein n=1 Tax=marine sediment metagenome TaxID=412755 RepID=A0A0F9RQ93_9ZZZZ